MKEPTIPLNVRELKLLIRQSAKLGVLEAMKYQQGQVISKTQAYHRYGKALILQLTEAGIISVHKIVLNHYIVHRYNVMEIEAAMTAMQMDQQTKANIENRHYPPKRTAKSAKTIVGLNALAEVYGCSYAKAKLLKKRLAMACYKDGRHVVIDLRKANEIIPIPPFKLDNHGKNRH